MATSLPWRLTCHHVASRDLGGKLRPTPTGRGVRSGTAFVLAALSACSAGRAVAQDLEYTTVTSFTVSGALGPMMQMVGGARPLSARAFLKGTRLRLDLGTASTVVDAAKREIVLLDHTRKTFSTTSFAAVARPATDSAPRVPGMSTTVDRTREIRRINEVDARRTNIIVRVPARNPRAPKATDVIVVTELWTSNVNGIGTTYDRVSHAAEEFGGGASMMLGLLAQNPRVGGALEQAAKASTAIRGLPVRRRTVCGNIPVGRKFAAGMPLDTMMATTTDITDIRNVSLPAALFQVPAGYTRTR